MKNIEEHLVEGHMKVTLWGGQDWFVIVDAKIDTGADRSSLDIALIEALEFLPARKSRKVRSANGVTTRDLYEVSIEWDSQPHRLLVSGADRSRMRYPMILGREDFLDLCEMSEEE